MFLDFRKISGLKLNKLVAAIEHDEARNETKRKFSFARLNVARQKPLGFKT